jgi:hypothetical protein
VFRVPPIYPPPFLLSSPLYFSDLDIIWGAP